MAGILVKSAEKCVTETMSDPNTELYSYVISSDRV
jgi:hypothetical protein